MLTVFGQSVTISNKELEPFDQIFGGSPLYSIGVDTVRTEGKTDIIVRDDCSVKAIDQSGQVKWDVDTSKLGCAYIQYGYFDEDLMWKSFRIDFFIQGKKNRLYIIDSEMGLIKRMSKRQFDKILKSNTPQSPE